MNCSKCASKNIIKANYCQKCGYKFTEEEKKNAYKKTLFYKLEMIEKWYNHLTLSTITGNIFFKIGSILIILFVGIYLLLTVGINTKILDSKEYKIFYNEKDNVYYLLTSDDKEEINVNLYKPNRLKELSIEHYDSYGDLINKVNVQDNIILKSYNDDYYVFRSKYDDKEEEMKVIVYKENEVI